MKKGLLPGNDKEECNTKCENRKDLMKHLEKRPTKRKHTTNANFVQFSDTMGGRTVASVHNSER